MDIEPPVSCGGIIGLGASLTAWPIEARALTWESKTPSEQAASAGVVVDATVARNDVVVLPEGDKVTWVRLEVLQVLRGEVPSQKLTLILPGALVDGRWEGVIGITPLVEGEHIVLFGDAVTTETVQMAAMLQSIFKVGESGSGPIAADYHGNTIVDLGCTVRPLFARPADQAPVPEAADVLAEVLGEAWVSATRTWIACSSSTLRPSVSRGTPSWATSARVSPKQSGSRGRWVTLWLLGFSDAAAYDLQVTVHASNTYSFKFFEDDFTSDERTQIILGGDAWDAGPGEVLRGADFEIVRQLPDTSTHSTGDFADNI